MALSLNNIEIDCAVGIDAAADVADAAAELDGAYSEAMAIVGDLAASWTGDKASRFLALLEERANALHEQANALRSIADAMSQTVEAYRQTQTEIYYAEQRKREKAGGL